MGYYDNPTEYGRRGIDYDLSTCLQYNPQSFDVDAIERVLAVVEGENDGADWHWLISLKDGRYAYLQGGCDYTGWDCQSSAVSWVEDTIDAALAYRDSGRWEDEARSREARRLLAQQAIAGKSETWRETKDKEFGSTPPTA